MTTPACILRLSFRYTLAKWKQIISVPQLNQKAVAEILYHDLITLGMHRPRAKCVSWGDGSIQFYWRDVSPDHVRYSTISIFTVFIFTNHRALVITC